MKHFQLDDHVPQELTFGGVAEGASVGEFMDLSDIVQESSGQDQITIDVRIVATNEVARREKRNHVIEESADEGMMQRLGSRGVLICAFDLRVSHECLYQST